MNIIDSTVKNSFCSGCGICETVCPVSAIKMVYDEKKEYKPSINKSKCNNCGLCEKICINSYQNKKDRVELLKNSDDPLAVGLSKEVSCFRCRNRDVESLMKSASGGFVTIFAKELLSKKMIDCVVHAKRRNGKTGEEHYEATVSTTAAEIEAASSSVYGPICFNKVIRQFANKDKKILFIGTPCVISSVKRLFNIVPAYKKNEIFTIALCCSHNVTGQFVDYLADLHGIDKNLAYTANLRAKTKEMPDHNNFFINFKKAQTQENVVLEERAKFFTPVWRSYSFAMDSCNYCPDFWGADADISTKDAWGKIGENDRYGSNIVIFRNSKLVSIFTQIQDFEIFKINYEDVYSCQTPTVEYKQKEIIDRFGLPDEKIKDNEAFLKNKKCAVSTKDIYANEGFEQVQEKVISKILNEYNLNEYKENVSKPKIRVKYAAKKVLRFFRINKLYHLVRRVLSCLRKLFKYQKKQYHKVVMMGSFNKINAGDEAQIDSTIKIMQDRYPDYLIEVLSHVEHYTHKHHHSCSVAPNSRECIWDHDLNPRLYYNMEDTFIRLRFLWKAYWTCFNAYFVRADLPTVFLSAKRASFLQEIKTCDLLYISGGGALTGATLSRCWDFMFCMKIARIMKVPCVLSGQNSGLWGSHYTENLVKKELKHAKAITLRDPSAVNNLEELGVSGDHVFTMFDDALFCEKLDDVSSYLLEYGINDEPYIALNMHYWGVENSKEEQKLICSRLTEFCEYMYSRTGYKMLLIPMATVDALPMEDFVGYARKDYIKVARYPEYDFKLIRGLFSKAVFTVTMKHHPIIFSVGEKIPTISIAYKPYYVYKNKGALDICELGKYSLDLEKEDYMVQFKTLFDDIYDNRSKIVDNLSSRLEILKERRERLFKIVDTILK